MGRILSSIGNAATRIESWWALLILLGQVGVFTWIGQQWEWLASQGWSATVLVAIICAAALTIAVSLVVLAVQSTRKASPVSQSGSTHSFPRHIVPEPEFGHPRQGASETYLSWWHIPINVHGDGGSPSPEILHCRIEMVSANPTDAELPLSLRWQQDNEARGVERITLIQGIPRLVPVAIRCETGREVAGHHQAIADGIARYTGAAYLRDGNIDKFQLSTGFNQFRLRIHSAARTFLSPIYMLRIPAPDDSNGSFIMETRDWT